MALTDRGRVLSQLRELAKAPDDGTPVISLYLDTAWDEERKRDAVRVFVKSRLRQALAAYAGDGDGRSSLEADAERIRGHVAELIAPGANGTERGRAVFASHGRGLWTTIAVPQPFDRQLVVRQVPYLIPLAKLVDDYQSALVCLVDSRSARILEVVFGGLAAEETIEHPDVPGRHHQGGWSQMRFQRHIDWAREQHVRDVADSFVKLADRDSGARLFLSGPIEAMSSLRGALPKRVLDRDPVDIGLGLDSGLPAVMQAVLAGIQSKERFEEADRVRSVLDATLAGQLAACGPEDVVAALNRGAVSLLLVHRGLELGGWRCARGCLAGHGKPPSGCPVCGEACARCDLSARLVEGVLASGGDVDMIHDDAALLAVGGVAARLRFAI